MSTIPKQLLFTVDEYRTRLQNTQASMERQGIDALVLHQQENVAWLSGFWHDGFFAYHALVVPAVGEPILIERDLENPVAEEMSWIESRRRYLDGDDVPALVAAAVKEVTSDKGVIGVEFDSAYFSVSRFQTLARLVGQRQLVSDGGLVDNLRQIKSAKEVDYIRTAGRIVSAAVAAGIEAAQVGATELDVASAIARAQAAHGHDSFMGSPGGTICTGWRTLQLHGQQTSKVIQSGDRIRLELPGIYNQYWAKQMRSGVIGKPDDALLRAHDIVSKAQDSALREMGPGVPFARITELCRRPVLDAGLVKQYENRVGYGLGLQFHPTSGDFSLDIDSRSTRNLEVGMVFHMLLFAAGAAISETVVITENGHEVLTSGDRSLVTRA